MNDTYRLLVTRRNKLNLLFWVLSKAHFPYDLMSKNRWALKYHLILRNQGSIYQGDFRRCQYCATPCIDLANLQRHCNKDKTCEERYDFLNFKGIYCCQFGCEGEYVSKAAIACHLITSHKEKELAVWGYKKDKLKKLLTREDL